MPCRDARHSFCPVRQLAETLLSQQETALTELGLELDEQYQLSHSEQAQLAAETADHAISDQAVGELSRLMEQEHLTGSVKHGNVGLPVNVKLENAEVRRLYVEEVSKIHESIDPTLPLEERARLAFEARNRLRTGARDIMADAETKKELDETRPNKTFEELVQSKMKRKGLSREEALMDVYRTAITTNSEVNVLFGIGG